MAEGMDRPMTEQARRERAATKAECFANRIMALRETRCEPHHHYLCDECAGQWIEAFAAQEVEQAVARERERLVKIARESWPKLIAPADAKRVADVLEGAGR